MEDMSEFRPGLNPAFVRRVQEKRRREAEIRRKENALAEQRRLREERIAHNERIARQMQELKAEARFSELIRRLQTDERPSVGPSAREIIAVIARKHGLDSGAIVGSSRQRHVVKARFEAIAEVRRLRPDLSSTQMGKIFGDRDHTTILHALRKIDARKEAA